MQKLPLAKILKPTKFTGLHQVVKEYPQEVILKINIGEKEPKYQYFSFKPDEVLIWTDQVKEVIRKRIKKEVKFKKRNEKFGSTQVNFFKATEIVREKYRKMQQKNRKTK